VGLLEVGSGKFLLAIGTMIREHIERGQGDSGKRVPSYECIYAIAEEGGHSIPRKY
jgi:hypothetical protein